MKIKSKDIVFYTIGHSTRSLGELAGMLESFSIKELIDVRTIPKSRFNPQFNKEALAKDLPARGIAYRHMAGLGGLRHPKKDSINTGWRNLSFRGYADYMQTPEFEKNLQELIALGKKHRVAVMCAEAVPWRCHRSLIADALIVHDFEVVDIMGIDKGSPHTLNPMADVHNRKIRYPKSKEELSEELF